MNRYHRQQQVSKLGAGSQQLLAHAKVLIVGLGGLGSPVATLLAGAGVGHLTLVDYDRVDLSNLHRQTVYCESDVGLAKATAAVSRLQAINSEIQINAVQAQLNPENVEDLVGSHTVVVDAADSFFASYLLSDVCFKHRIPLVAASVLQTSGYLGVFCGTAARPAPSMRAVFPSPPLSTQTCDTAGVTGPSVGVIGSLQAQEVLKVIVQDKHQLLGKIMYVDCWQHSQHTISFATAKEPKSFAKLVLANNAQENDTYLDLRSNAEVAQASGVNSAMTIPVDELMSRVSELPHDRRIVCVCKSGQRALYAAHQLITHGFDNVVAGI